MTKINKAVHITDAFLKRRASSIGDYFGAHVPLMHLYMAAEAPISGFVNTKTFKLSSTKDMLNAIPEMRAYLEEDHEGNYTITRDGFRFLEDNFNSRDAIFSISTRNFVRVTN